MLFEEYQSCNHNTVRTLSILKHQLLLILCGFGKIARCIITPTLQVFRWTNLNSGLSSGRSADWTGNTCIKSFLCGQNPAKVLHRKTNLWESMNGIFLFFTLLTHVLRNFSERTNKVEWCTCGERSGIAQVTLRV